MRASDRTFHVSFTSSVWPHAYCPTCGSALGAERRRRLLVSIFDSVCHRPVCLECAYRYAPSLAALVQFEHGDPAPGPKQPRSTEPQQWEVLRPVYEREFVEEEPATELYAVEVVDDAVEEI